MSSVCVHGLGYIGLPTSAMLANYDHDVYGYDADADVTERLAEGDVHLDEPGLRAFVNQALDSGNLEIVDDVVAAKYHIICVPTPFDEKSKEAGLDYVKSAGEAVNPVLREGDTVILESTVPPGTTVDVLQPILEDSGLSAGADFALVHCPETVLPGNIITELRQNNRIIGGVNGVSTEAAVHLYNSFVEGDIKTTSDATTAEFVKLIQNTFRDTNIALANEIAKLSRDYNIDSREAIALANEHPRVDILQPGPGVGGHCLPIDPWFLGQNSDSLDLIARAREVNDGMVDYVIALLKEQLGSLHGRKVAILGVAYKGNVADTRMSPGLELARQLAGGEQRQKAVAADGGAEGVEIAIHDPKVTDPTLANEPFENAISDADAAVIMTDHDEFEEIKPESIAGEMTEQVVVDSKGMLDQQEWEAAGFAFSKI